MLSGASGNEGPDRKMQRLRKLFMNHLVGANTNYRSCGEVNGRWKGFMRELVAVEK